VWRGLYRSMIGVASTVSSFLGADFLVAIITHSQAVSLFSLAKFDALALPQVCV
jgi:hypothetical protein